MAEIGKMLLALGVAIAAIGALFVLCARLGLPLGRLPGDIAWRGKRVSVFFPLGTSLLLSLALTLVLYLFSSFRR